MALPSNSELALMDESSLKDWELKARGGFGHIYKARHIEWRWDVAIKVLEQYEGSSKLLLHEAELMRKGGSNFVIRVQGVFRGHVGLPNVSSIQDGLVMEFMERGSLASLQETLNNPPQKTLVFRMAHQVALGMNYLHSLTPPLLHLDLKPGNVLLDKDLNVKITDFGLSKISSSMTSRRSGGQPGTIKYMPPEALTSISYKAIGAYDVYSYGITLWSIVMWKEPYENVIPARIELLIPKGNDQRPSLEEMNPEQDPRLEKLQELMEKCWDQEPKQRPPFRGCIDVTEDLCKDYKEHEITDAVHQVQKELAQQEDEIPSSASSNGKSMSASSRTLTELPVIQGFQSLSISTGSADSAVGLSRAPQTREDFLQYARRLTLDLNTVHNWVSLSEQNRKVTLTDQELQYYPGHPERFTIYTQVLCTEILSERCYWEVEWSGGVVIAVSYKDIHRGNVESLFGANDKSWGLLCSDTGFALKHKMRDTTVCGPRSSRVVGVYLDHSGGTLSFYSVSDNTMSPIHKVETKFTQALHPGIGPYLVGSTGELCEIW